MRLPKSHHATAVHNKAAVCRQGLGVNGGEPLGFDVGAKAAGGTLPGLDLVRAALHCHSEGPSLIC